MLSGLRLEDLPAPISFPTLTNRSWIYNERLMGYGGLCSCSGYGGGEGRGGKKEEHLKRS